MTRRSVRVAAAVAFVCLTVSGTAANAATTAASAKYLSVRIKLPVSQMVAGSTANGTLIVTNSSDDPIELTVTTAHCRPDWSVALMNKNIPPEVAGDANCGYPPIVVMPGTTRFPFALPATYQAGCFGGTDGQPTAAIPRCTADGHIPDLPPGKYRAVIVGLPVPVPDPVRMQVVA